MKEIILVGYSGHGLVAADILIMNGYNLKYYCDLTLKEKNPFNLQYLGPETQLDNSYFSAYDFFIGIGNNQIRKNVDEFIHSRGGILVNAIHLKSIVSRTSFIENSVMIAAGACINSSSSIGRGVICNTSCIIEHECKVGNYSHIAPGAVLCGNVEVGLGSFIGANAVIKQGVTVGKNCIVGAGSVVLRDIPDGSIVVGNPAKKIN